MPYLNILLRQEKINEIILITYEKEEKSFNRVLEIDKPKGKKFDHIKYRYSRNLAFASLNVLKSILSLRTIIVRKDINYIHTWCSPAGSLGYLLSILTNRKLILDSFEPHADPMVDSGTWKKNGIKYNLLKFFEKLQVRRADSVIGVTESVKNYVQDVLHYYPKSFFVKPACVDYREFVSEQNVEASTITGIYVGKIGDLYFEKEFFEFLKIAQDTWMEKFRFIILTGSSHENIYKNISKYQINKGYVKVLHGKRDEVINQLGRADYGINIMKPVPSRKYCTPVKDGEYWAAGLPLIIGENISDDSGIVRKHKIGVVLKDFSKEEFKRAVLEMSHLIRVNGLSNSIREVAERYRGFSLAEKVYKELYG